MTHPPAGTPDGWRGPAAPAPSPPRGDAVAAFRPLREKSPVVRPGYAGRTHADMRVGSVGRRPAGRLLLRQPRLPEAPPLPVQRGASALVVPTVQLDARSSHMEEEGVRLRRREPVERG